MFTCSFFVFVLLANDILGTRKISEDYAALSKGQYHDIFDFKYFS